jgi:hypothetical protein
VGGKPVKSLADGGMKNEGVGVEKEKVIALSDF